MERCNSMPNFFTDHYNRHVRRLRGRVAMRKHTLKNAPGVELSYSVISQPQEGTHDQEPLEADIEILNIHILSRETEYHEFCELLRANRGEWVQEILTSLKGGENGL